MVGNSALKSARRGTNQWVRKLEVVVTVSAGGCRARVIWATDCSSAAKARWVPEYRISPVSVRLTPCALRSHTRHSSTDSSSLIWWLTAVALTPSASAASLKLRQPATAWKARSAPSGGKRGFLMAELFSSKAENYEFV
ncbi:Uncharacterised protein [Acinetobacter baumannii]|nr:Uncharacterised protein [Acinetobacter baumannii]